MKALKLHAGIVGLKSRGWLMGGLDANRSEVEGFEGPFRGFGYQFWRPDGPQRAHL